MNVSLNWLTDYVNIHLPADELAELFMRIGFCIDDIKETDADIVFDVEVTSNRPDCLGHIGLARELAAAMGGELKLPDLTGIPMGGAIDGQTSVEVLNPEFCPRYTARLIRNVKVGPSPSWMVERLEAVGLRSINNVVDVTNYVLMEYSQPLHAFDFDKLAGGRIVVRQAKDGERITAIDGSKHELRDWMGIIADADRPVAVAGVMGGLDTEVSDGTVNVLMEAARFDPLSIRKTSRHLNLMSDSSYRFERGVDPVALERASLRACQLILATAGGELAEGIVDVWADPFEPMNVPLRPARCSALLGVDIPADRQMEILATLGLKPHTDGPAIHCEIPAHRPDLTREVDLIEEVARIHGFDKIPTGGAVTHQVTAPSPTESARRAVGDVLNAAGYFEAVTFTFIDREEAELLGWMNSLSVDPRLRKSNGVLRQGLLGSLLRARKANQDAGNADVRLFELAAVFPPAGGDEQLPQEYTQLGMLTDGSVQDVRGAVEAVVRRFDPAATVTVKPADAPGLAPSGAAELWLSDRAGETMDVPFGTMGLVEERVCDYYGLTARPSCAMLRFDQLLALGQVVRTWKPVARFPGIERDLSLIVDEAITWDQMAQVVQEAGGQLVRGLDYVGAYRGKQVGKGRKSITLRLTYRHDDRTLRHEEVEPSVEAVVKEMAARYGAELRA